MAGFQSFYGPWVYSGASRGRLRQDFSYTPDTITTATASITVGYRLWFETNDAVSDTSNSGATSGDLGSQSGSTNISHGSSGGATMLFEASAVFPLVYGSTQVVDQAGSLTGINAIPGTFTIDSDYVIPARPFAVPTAPSGVAGSRVSDTSHTVSWTRNPSTAGPYTSQQVQRSTDGGSWATVATVSGTATSWTDTTTSADHSYAWRVVAVNLAGSATSAASATLYTTPKAPGTPTAVKSGSNIVLNFTNTARHDVGVKVYASQDGGAFSLLATVATPNLTGYTHTSPSSAVTWAYKVATYNGSLTSAQSAASNTVQLAAPPNAPTNLAPTTVRDATEGATLTWQHNPVDTSAQRKRQIRYRVQGDVTWTEGITPTSSTQSAWVDPLSFFGATNGQTLEWQVRTWGDHADPSPWSATATIPLSTRPTATISSPTDAEEIATSALTVEWAYYDAESTDQAAWQVELYDATDALVETLSGVGDATSATLTTVLGDDTSWTVRVRVQDGAGLWSEWDEAAFTVAYALPPQPTATLAWDALAGTITVSVTVPDAVEGEVDAEHVDVWRSIDYGEWVLIATGVPLDTAVTDYSPTVAGSNRYRAVAVSALPSQVSSAVVEEVTSGARAVFISGGPGFSQVCRAVSNVAIGISPARAKVLRRYAGRTSPVEHTGEQRTKVLSLTTDHIPMASDPGSTPGEWEALGDLAGPHLWRDPDGRYVVVSIGTPDIQRAISGVSYRIGVSATEVDSA